MKPDYKTILEEAKRLKEQRYKERDQKIAADMRVRFGKDIITIPEAYRDGANPYHSPVLQEEGRQVAAILEAKAQPHVVPPSDEHQPVTTLIEQWLAAGDIELDSVYGNCIDKANMAQVHQAIGWVYEAPKRAPYEGAPEPPDDESTAEETLDYAAKNRDYKQTEGIAGFLERRFVPTETVYCTGDVRNPRKFYEIKEVDEQELLDTYGLTKNSDGTYSKPSDVGTMPSGKAAEHNKKVKIIEYWDRQWMCILIENPLPGWRDNATPMELDSWEHGFGRVPFFPIVAFENETLDEHTKFEGPLNGIYVEVPHHNELMTMKRNVTRLRSYPSWQIVTKEQGDQVLDENGQRKVYVKFKPGEMFQAAPGQEVKELPMQVGNDLLQEVMASDARIKQFSLADVSKGVSPGADTANSAISNLRRLQRSSLERMAQNRANMYRDIYRFRLERLKDYGETVYVYDSTTGDMIGLAADQVVTTNVHVKYEPDTGNDKLIEEKQAADLTAAGLITDLEFHERRGKENPEEFVLASIKQKVRMTMLPNLITQILANLGDTQAIAQLIQANQQTGDARSAVSPVLDQMQQMQSGLGQGSAGMPRGEGVRSPALAANTAPQMNGTAQIGG